MALPIIAPAARPPRIPAPTAQPTQSAFAGAGATARKLNALRHTCQLKFQTGWIRWVSDRLFDAHNVSFVSVAQQFNTTTSTGRLTLNVF
jgi:hypothetical protein